MNTQIGQEITNFISHFAGEQVKEVNNVSGGCIHNALQINLESGRKLFAKTSPLEQYKMLNFEAEGLHHLNKYINKEFINIPKVLISKKLSTINILLMTWMDFSTGNENNLGRGLAMLHKQSNSENPGQFGWNKDGFIGSSPQVRGWMKSWGECFVKLRLIPQLKMAKKWLSDLEKPNFESQLIKYLNKHQPQPSLVHGDLWKGNTAVQKNGVGIIFDPAIWWADREVDIAMTKLFGGFSQEFYRGYEEIWQLPSSYKERSEIYNLYHLLNHANIFGGIYKQTAICSLKKVAYFIDNL